MKTFEAHAELFEDSKLKYSYNEGILKLEFSINKAGHLMGRAFSNNLFARLAGGGVSRRTKVHAIMSASSKNKYMMCMYMTVNGKQAFFHLSDETYKQLLKELDSEIKPNAYLASTTGGIMAIEVD